MKSLKFIPTIIFVFVSFLGNTQVQTTEKDSLEEIYVQISGIIVTGSNLTPLTEVQVPIITVFSPL